MRIDLLEAFGLTPKVIVILKEKYGAKLLSIREWAFKEPQVLNGGSFLANVKLLNGSNFMNEGQRLFFYRGCPIKLQPACFQYLLIPAENQTQIVGRYEIPRRHWLSNMKYGVFNKPYEH